jgi:hypothetical protein
MKIVQSFWSAKRNLLEDSFGWLTPQFHIMAWALSCLKLREHYSDLHLYTDKNGYEIFKNYLNLPYKKVHANYDQINNYHQNLWALPKILTYSVQDQPFLHIDGDVFVWERFCPKLEAGRLIAQNLEEGTEYYKGLMSDVQKDLHIIPDFLTDELKKRSIGSYNAGILGGSDLKFIRKYANEALRLINLNYTDNDNKIPSFNFNILFEQVLFFALSKKYHKQVCTLFPETFIDLGYTTSKFADFTAAKHELKYLHVIGAKKREYEICELISRALLTEYPDCYYKIVSLFKNHHVFYQSKISQAIPQISNEAYQQSRNTDASLRHKTDLQNDCDMLAEEGFANLKLQWENISGKDLLQWDFESTKYYDYFFMEKEIQLNTPLKRHAYLQIDEESFFWPDEKKKRINPKLIGDKDENLGLVYIPELFNQGFSHIVIDELDYNILAMLQQPCRLVDIIFQVDPFFHLEDHIDKESVIYELITLKLRKLFFYKCVYLCN